MIEEAALEVIEEAALEVVDEAGLEVIEEATLEVIAEAGLPIEGVGSAATVVEVALVVVVVANLVGSADRANKVVPLEPDREAQAGDER